MFGSGRILKHLEQLHQSEGTNHGGKGPSLSMFCYMNADGVNSCLYTGITFNGREREENKLH